MTEPVTVGIGATKWVKDSNTKMITLHASTEAGTGSFHDDSDTDYQVPSGKKFIILEVSCSATYAGDGQRSVQIQKSSTTDTAGTVVLKNIGTSYKYQSSSYSSMSEHQLVPNIQTYIEIPAGNFIIGVTSNAYANITGVETDV
jgi:type 1 fimbria pilin